MVIINILIQIIGGLGMFLYGMKIMSDSIQELAGHKLREMISRMTSNVFGGIMTGALMTIIVQSSSVTTVMVVGFLNAFLMTLRQAVGVILGAGVGTTLTGWVLALEIDKYGLLIIGIGTLTFLFAKSIKIRKRALAGVGIGMIFFGLYLMKSGVMPVKDMPRFVSFFYLFSADTYRGVVYSALMGAFVTSILQSSAATIGITMALATQGIITPDTAVALVLGQNIGTTITAYLASLGAKLYARRAAYAHIIIKIIGVLIIIPLFYVYTSIVAEIVDPKKNIAEYIALSHTIFNVGLVFVFVPFISLFLKLLEKIGNEKKEIEGEYSLEKLYNFPGIVLEKEKMEVIQMSKRFKDDMELFFLILTSEEKGEKVKKIFEGEEYHDRKKESIQKELTELLSVTNSYEILNESRMILRVSDELESMGDYGASLAKIYIKMKNTETKLSKERLEEIKNCHIDVMGSLEIITKLIENSDVYELKKLKGKCDNTSLSLSNLNPLKKEDYSNHICMEILAKYRRINRYISYIIEKILEKMEFEGIKNS